ncbi:MAG TPA: hypothetical protein VNU25_00400 [Candidatus Paceibacterota bacterium]|nr:hypothetical protein [Candidatus Paceibacterota bacterium]
MSGRRLLPEHDSEATARLLGNIEAMTKEHAKRFEALPETEQVLYLNFQELSIAYGVYDRTRRPREEVAREYLLRRFGPKFAERVLGDETYRKLLKLDDAPVDADESLGTI